MVGKSAILINILSLDTTHQKSKDITMLKYKVECLVHKQKKRLYLSTFAFFYIKMWTSL